MGSGLRPVWLLSDRFATHVLFVVGWYGEGENPAIGSMLRRIVTFPPFVALIAALALGNAWFPDWLMVLTERFADMLLPLVTLAIGLSLRLRLVPDYRLGLAIGLIGKLLAAAGPGHVDCLGNGCRR